MDILILLGLIGLSAVISTAEIGFFSVNETRLKALAQNGSKRAAKALQLRSDPQKLLAQIRERLQGDLVVRFTDNLHEGMASAACSLAVVYIIIIVVVVVEEEFPELIA